jgi:hypothetical protein
VPQRVILSTADYTNNGGTGSEVGGITEYLAKKLNESTNSSQFDAPVAEMSRLDKSKKICAMLDLILIKR